MKEPTLFIIAGPNGAGKSTVSKQLLKPYNIKAFDFDQRFHDKWKTFDFDPIIESGIRNSVIKDFEKHISERISKKEHVAFETNFHTRDVLDYLKDAKGSGLCTSLVFIGLANDQIAINRVKQRVTLGGHLVSDETVKFRYQKGLEILDQSFNEFDIVHIFESLQDYKIERCIDISAAGNRVYALPSFINELPNLKSLLKPQ